jgi:hypothetical protein
MQNTEELKTVHLEADVNAAIEILMERTHQGKRFLVNNLLRQALKRRKVIPIVGEVEAK